MKIHPHPVWLLRIATFVLAALAAASAAYWTLKWIATTPSTSSSAVMFSGPAPVDPQALARVLGGGQVAGAVAAPVQAAPGKYKLTGVVAGRSAKGYAVISIDGQPARPFRVGAPVADMLVLHSVTPRSAALAPGPDAPPTLLLDLPTLAPP